jgi:hypothetical protein
MELKHSAHTHIASDCTVDHLEIHTFKEFNDKVTLKELIKNPEAYKNWLSVGKQAYEIFERQYPSVRMIKDDAIVTLSLVNLYVDTYYQNLLVFRAMHNEREAKDSQRRRL